MAWQNHRWMASLLYSFVGAFVGALPRSRRTIYGPKHEFQGRHGEKQHLKEFYYILLLLLLEQNSFNIKIAS